MTDDDKLPLAATIRAEMTLHRDKTLELAQLDDQWRKVTRRMGALPQHLPQLSPDNAPPRDLQQEYQTRRSALDMKINRANQRFNDARENLRYRGTTLQSRFESSQHQLAIAEPKPATEFNRSVNSPATDLLTPTNDPTQPHVRSDNQDYGKSR